MLTLTHPLPTQAAQVSTQHPPAPSQYDLLNFLKPPRFWPSAMAVLGGGCRDREGQVYKLEACPCPLLPSCPPSASRFALSITQRFLLAAVICSRGSRCPLLSPVVPAVPSWPLRSHQWDCALGLPQNCWVPAVERDGGSMDGGPPCIYGVQPRAGAPRPHRPLCWGSCAACGSISMGDAVAQSWRAVTGPCPQEPPLCPCMAVALPLCSLLLEASSPRRAVLHTERAGGCACLHVWWCHTGAEAGGPLPPLLSSQTPASTAAVTLCPGGCALRRGDAGTPPERATRPRGAGGSNPKRERFIQGDNMAAEGGLQIPAGSAPARRK